MEKSSGNILPRKFFAPTGMVLHHINAYEDKGKYVSLARVTMYIIDCMHDRDIYTCTL